MIHLAASLLPPKRINWKLTAILILIIQAVALIFVFEVYAEPDRGGMKPTVQRGMVTRMADGTTITKKIAGDVSSQTTRDDSKDWNAVFDDDFESGFPGTTWTLYDQSVSAGAYWDDWTCWSGASSSHSVGCAAGGTSAINCGGQYPSYMEAWMIHGPFSLAGQGFTNAMLEFNMNLNSEEGYDEFFVGVSVDGGNFHGVFYSGSSTESILLDMNDLEVPSDVCESSQVSIAFIFFSDEIYSASNGAQIDDVVVWGETASNEIPTVTLTNPTGGETFTAGETVTITYNANDPDNAPSPLAVSILFMPETDAAWQTLTEGQANTGSWQWTVPAIETTSATIAVIVGDGAINVGYSSGLFTIEGEPNIPPTVSITSPVGGETYASGQVTTITYDANDPDSGPSELLVAFMLSTNNGDTWNLISQNNPNTGSYQWTVPEVETTTAKIGIFVSDGASLIPSASPNFFTITSVSNTLAFAQGGGPSGTTVAVPFDLLNDQSVKGLQLDVQYDPSIATLVGVTADQRGAGMMAASSLVSPGVGRIIMYFDDETVLNSGAGVIGHAIFTVQGAGSERSEIMPLNMILSGPNSESLPVAGASGFVYVEEPTGVPVIQISALKNPGRTRSLQLFVRVSSGSGNLPTLTADGAAVTLTQMNGSLYLGTFTAELSVTSLVFNATDTNAIGDGTSQVTVSFP